MAKIHLLKTWPEHWDAIERGEKTFEARVDDRGYGVGDVLVLRRHDPDQGDTTDEKGFPMDLSKRVTHMLYGGAWGIAPTHVVMSLGPIAD